MRFLHKIFNLYKLNPKISIRKNYTKIKIKKKIFKFFFRGGDSWGLRPMLQWGSHTSITGFCLQKSLKILNFVSGDFFIFGGVGVSKKIAKNHQRTSRYIPRRVEPNLITSFWGVGFFYFLGGLGVSHPPRK